MLYCGCGPLYIAVHSGTADRSNGMCCIVAVCHCTFRYIAVEQIVAVLCCGCGPLYIAVHSGTADRISGVLWLWAVVHNGT